MSDFHSYYICVCACAGAGLGLLHSPCNLTFVGACASSLGVNRLDQSGYDRARQRQLQFAYYMSSPRILS
jgi:hypothetical protein